MTSYITKTEAECVCKKCVGKDPEYAVAMCAFLRLPSEYAKKCLAVSNQPSKYFYRYGRYFKSNGEGITNDELNAMIKGVEVINL